MKLNFNLSLKYYEKDKQHYFVKDCHVNTYIRFFGLNYGFNYKLVTGYLVDISDEVRVMSVHSWIEYNNQVIDVTKISNLEFQFGGFTNDLKSKLRHKLENLIYIPCYSLDSTIYEIKVRTWMSSSNSEKEAMDKAIEWISPCIEKLLKDEQNISILCKTYNCVFADDVFTNS